MVNPMDSNETEGGWMDSIEPFVLGTLTIVGRWPMEADGLQLGYTKAKRRVYKLTTKGFLRGRKLFKTLDPQVMVEAWEQQGCQILSWKMKNKVFNP